MFKRLLPIRLNFKVYNSHTYLYCQIPSRNQSCNHCGFRLYSSHKVSALRNYYERSDKRIGIFYIKSRYYTSQVDAQKKNDSIATLKDKATIVPSKKINVKLKSSELKRLFNLAEPEKWTLAGK